MFILSTESSVPAVRGAAGGAAGAAAGAGPASFR